MTQDRQIIEVKPRNIQAAALHPGHYNSTIGHTINKFPEYVEQGYGQLQKNEFVASPDIRKSDRSGTSTTRRSTEARSSVPPAIRGL